MVQHRQSRDLFSFPLEIAALGTNRAVGDALLRALHPFGITSYAIGAFPHPDAPCPGGFIVTNWPEAARGAYQFGQVGEHDPVLRAVKFDSAPVSISEIREGRAGFVPSSQELELLDTVIAKGHANGLIVPILGAYGYRGIGCVSGPCAEPDARARVVIQFLVWHAHDRMRALYAASSAPRTLRLSLREREVLNAARRGMSDEEIAQTAGIAVRTVRFHFENARRKLEARNRSEAIAKAVQLQLLGV